MTYTSQEVVMLTGLSYRQLDYACNDGLVMPAQAAQGSGTIRKFDADNVAILRLLAVLRTMGMTGDRIRNVIRCAAPEGKLLSGVLIAHLDGKVEIQDGYETWTSAGWLVDLDHVGNDG